MKKMLSGIVKLSKGESEEDFQEKLKAWIHRNGWEYQESEIINTPQNDFAPLTIVNASVIGSAVFHTNYNNVDEDQEFNRRYFLRRTWDANGKVMAAFLMNPSNANELVNDETVSFMMNYAKYNGFGSLIVVNTSPVIKGSGTTNSDFIVDDNNWFYIENAINKANLVVLGWGENGRQGIRKLRENGYALDELLKRNRKKLRVFGYGFIGECTLYPKHPHPQMVEDRFSLDHELETVTEEDRLNLLRWRGVV